MRSQGKGESSGKQVLFPRRPGFLIQFTWPLVQFGLCDRALATGLAHSHKLSTTKSGAREERERERERGKREREKKMKVTK